MKDEIKLDKSSYGMFIFRGDLALECYFDIDNNKDKYIELYNKFCNDINKYRKLTVKDEDSVEKMVEELKSIIITLGKENFSIDEDGYIEYIGDVINKNKGDEK